MDYVETLKTVLLENVNVEGIAFGVIDEVLEEALKEVVADMDNPLTDVLMASIYPPLELAIKAIITKKLVGLLE